MEVNMKTNVLKFAAILLILARGFSSCENNDVYLGTAECGKFNVTEEEFISWCLEPYVVTRDSENKLILENHTERVLSYCPVYSLDYFYKSEWRPVDLTNQPWLSITYHLGPYETVEGYANTWLLYLVKEYNNSKKGKYRIGKEYRVYSFVPARPFEFSIKLYAEFVIK